MVVALCEELVERGGLYTALGQRSEDELCELLKFLTWKVADHRYANVLADVCRITLDMYAGVAHMSRSVLTLLDELQEVVGKEIRIAESLTELDGQIEMLIGGLTTAYAAAK